MTSLITSIPNACDLELFQPLQQGVAKQPELIPGLPYPMLPGSFVVAFTGAHGLANGLDAVLDVAAELSVSAVMTSSCCSSVMVAVSRA